MGSFLIEETGPASADAILVLAGDCTGNRVLRAASLARDGVASRVFVTGPVPMYGRNEADLAIDYAVSKGYPREQLVPLYMKARSTRAEVAQAAPVLRREGVRRLLVVTSNYHTRRAGRVCRSILPEMEVWTVAAPTEDFHPDGWWRRRQDQKTFLVEWEKTIADWLGI